MEGGTVDDLVNGERMFGEQKALFTCVLVAAMMTATGLLTAQPARASITFTVSNTGDPGDGNCSATLGCTLRGAINAANSTPREDLIRFNIPNPGVQTIRPISELPEIVRAVTIDGYTQPEATPNTLATGTNSKLMIELDGIRAGADSKGLEIRDNLGGGETVIRGLAINRFGGSGNGFFSFSPAQKIATGQTITATASNNVTGDTSEFSAPRAVVAQ